MSAPIQQCDASSRNFSEAFNTILAHCLFLARQKFSDIYEIFPEQCKTVIDALATVYHHDDLARQGNLSDEERLQFHQQLSKPVMDSLHEWLLAKFDQYFVEPNSSLGRAIKYMLKYWEPLTLFLRVPGVPLDNNICEQALNPEFAVEICYSSKTFAATLISRFFCVTVLFNTAH